MRADGASLPSGGKGSCVGCEFIILFMDLTTRTSIWQLIATILGAVIAFIGVRWNEQFRAKSADESRERQWRQDQRLKIYSQLLEAVNDYSVWLGDLSETGKFGDSTTGTTMGKGPARIAEDFHSAFAVAPLFLSKGSLELLERAKPVFSYHASPFGDYPNVDAADKHWKLLKDIRRDLTSSATRDLGLG